MNSGIETTVARIEITDRNKYKFMYMYIIFYSVNMTRRIHVGTYSHMYMYIIICSTILTVCLHQRHLKSCSRFTEPHALIHTIHLEPVGRLPVIHWWGMDNCINWNNVLYITVVIIQLSLWIVFGKRNLNTIHNVIAILLAIYGFCYAQ